MSAGFSSLVSVSNVEQLQNALAGATGGETILLAAGTYGSLGLIAGHTRFDVTHSAAAPVTIRSADAGRPAVFTGLDLRGASGYTFENLTFDYTYKAADPIWVSPFKVTSSSDITIRGCTFDGDVAVNRNATDDGLGFGSGFGARFATNLVFENNTIFDFYRAAGFGESTNVLIRGNDVHSIRMDGLTFGSVQGVQIENNHIHDFNRAIDSVDHADMIQFWTTGATVPSTDIVIRNNLLDIAGGDFTQSIFMRNELVDTGAAGTEMFYRNVLIEGNTIYNDHLHGITLGEATGVVIRNNTVLHADGRTDPPTGTVSIPAIGVAAASTGVSITENLVARIGTGLQGYGSLPAGWVVANNLLVQDQDSTNANHYSGVFLSTSLHQPTGPHDFLAIPGGLIETMGVGTDLIRIDKVPDQFTPLFHVSTLPEDQQVYVFDAASYSYGPDGVQCFCPGRFVWDFGDGTYASGRLVQHRYATPGSYDVTLTVRLADSSTIDFTDNVVKTHDHLVHFHTDTGQFHVLFGTGNTPTLLTPKSGVVTVGDMQVLDLGAPGVTASIPVKAIEGLFSAESFDLDLRLQADAPTGWGEVFRLHNTFVGAVTRSGDFSFQLNTNGAPAVALISKGVSILDGQAHDISIRYDADVGFISLMVDGKITTQIPLTTPLPKLGIWDLTFGSPWGGQNFDGKLSHFNLDDHRADYADYVYGAISLPPCETTDVPESLWQTYTQDPDGPFDRLLVDDAAMLALRPTQLWGASQVQTVGDDTRLTFGGRGSEVRLDVIDSFRDADQIAFTLDFQRATPDVFSSGLVRNGGQLDLSQSGDGLILQVATATEGFKRYDIKNLGLRDTDWHEVSVLFDPVNDQLKLYLDEVLVLDDRTTDLAMVNPQGAVREGWVLGRGFTGTIDAFDLSENINQPYLDGDAFLFTHKRPPANLFATLPQEKFSRSLISGQSLTHIKLHFQNVLYSFGGIGP